MREEPLGARRRLIEIQSFGHGIGDGLKDFFVQPVIGTQKEGTKGLIKGFGRGTGNLVCKTAAGMMNLLAFMYGWCTD